MQRTFTMNRSDPAHLTAHPASTRASRILLRAVAAAALATLAACAGTPTVEAPQVDRGANTQALKKLQRNTGDRVAVSIYEFRSTVAEIAARGTTDMFKTALVQSGQFRVVERARLNEGVTREKQLNASGLSTGKAGAELLTGARYIFEGAITEANASQTQRSGGFSIAGMELSGSTNKDVIALDVRIVEVATGDIVDVVTVRKSVASDSVGVSGIGNVIGNVLAKKGRSTTYVPDLQLQQQRKESLDLALRSAIEQAVIELASRFPGSTAAR
jgi:curli biogenesis system outer membrane secretion channel CsgG